VDDWHEVRIWQCWSGLEKAAMCINVNLANGTSDWLQPVICFIGVFQIGSKVYQRLTG
jgi:hypothetical protein